MNLLVGLMIVVTLAACGAAESLTDAEAVWCRQNPVEVASAVGELDLEDELHLTETEVLLLRLVVSQGDVAAVRRVVDPWESRNPEAYARACRGAFGGR